MGLSYAVPVTMPDGVRRETGDNPPQSRAPSDGNLIRRVARRDANAFEALYRRYARAVFGLALRRLGDRMRAEDVVQETFAAVWRSARTYNPERGAGPARRPTLPQWTRVPTSAPRPRTYPGASTARSRSCRPANGM